MDRKRKGEIALLFLESEIRKRGIRVGQDTMQELGSLAKEVGITTEEAVEFAEELTRELVDDVFSKKAKSGK